MAETGGYHVVLGATGGAGRALVAELARQGRRVRAVGRRASEPWPKGVEAVTADILQSDEVRKACRDAAVVYHAANVPYAQWQQVLPAMTESVIAAASADLVDLGRLVIDLAANGAGEHMRIDERRTWYGYGTATCRPADRSPQGRSGSCPGCSGWRARRRSSPSHRKPALPFPGRQGSRLVLRPVGGPTVLASAIAMPAAPMNSLT